MAKTQIFRYLIISTILFHMETGLPVPIYIIPLKSDKVFIQKILMSMKAKMAVFRLKKSKRMNLFKSKTIQIKATSK